jgi:hypothetical protein
MEIDVHRPGRGRPNVESFVTRSVKNIQTGTTNGNVGTKRKRSGMCDYLADFDACQLHSRRGCVF